MPDYLLDTTTIIDYLRDKGGVPELLEELCTAGGLLCCCPLNIVEIYEGMKDKEKTATDEFLNSLMNSLKIMWTLIYKIPPNLPFPKGGIRPLFGKEG